MKYVKIAIDGVYFNNIEALHDSGSQVNLIRKSIIPEDQMKAVGRIAIRGAFGAPVQTDLVLLSIKPAVSGTNEVNIAPSLEVMFAICEELNECIILTADTVNKLELLQHLVLCAPRRDSTSFCMLLPFITIMCNASLREGFLPASQKAAIITPILKKVGLDVDDAKSYRPISNLTFVSKVIERIVADQIKAFLAESDLMPPLQSAYRPGHSTETATMKVISDILDAVDSQKTTLLGLLDMSAAFDTVDFDILIRRLETPYSLGVTVLKWLTSFVTGRTQAVAFDGEKSAPVNLVCGVPQGSVLRPLLFVLYAAEVLGIAISHGVQIHAYADDLQTYVSCNAINQQAAVTQILLCVDEIGNWM